MKNLKFLLTILFCSLTQISFSQSWLTSGNVDITDNSYIGSNATNDKDIVFKRAGVVGLTVSKFTYKAFFQPEETYIYVHTPRLQVGGY